MSRGHVLPAAAAALALALATAVGSLGASASRTDISSNWAGYVAMGLGSTKSTASSEMTYTRVTGRWVQPRGICKRGIPTSAAIWVGLGGYSETSQALEQAGTSADCDESGRVTYYIWYELIPADSVNVKVRIAPGDTIVSTVVVNDTDVLVRVNDQTRGVVFARHLSMSAPDLTSAEWIAEAPSYCSDSGFCPQLPLTRFTRLTFSRAFATGNDEVGPISSPSWLSTALQLVPRGAHRFFGDRNDPTGVSGAAGAIPSPLADDGSGFSITWQANPALAATVASATNP